MVEAGEHRQTKEQTLSNVFSPGYADDNTVSYLTELAS